MDTIKMSSKNQIVVPKEGREELGIKAGDELLVVCRRGMLYILPKPKSFVQALKGIARGRLHYPRNYLKKERASW